ncbi:MAG: glucose-6-P dehydrogenase subunit-like protein [Chloroflexi bacterium]|nr:glucose-6-P dehydrogenase subunit-like protein [Chloroflexota bacterium]
MSTPAPHQATWSATSVPLVAIEAELDRLWHTATRYLQAELVAAGRGPDVSQAAAPSSIRASVLNFVAYAGGSSVEPGTDEQLTKLADYLATKHRSRTVTIVAHENAADVALIATIRTNAQDGASGRKFIHEQVLISADGAVGERLPSIVMPLLISDLPTYVWWPGDPPSEDSFWRYITGTCRHFIINSREFSKPLESLSRYASLSRNARKYQTFGDLSWRQLSPWRELVARFFDNQYYRPFLNGVESVTIDYSGGSKWEMADGAANACPALLLAGWLSSRLGWSAVNCEWRDDGFDIACTDGSSGRDITVHFKSRLRPDVSSATIDAIRLKTANSGIQAYFDVVRQDNSSVARATAHVDGRTDSILSVRMTTEDLPALMAMELKFCDQDKIYEAALDAAGNMATLAQKQPTG